MISNIQTHQQAAQFINVTTNDLAAIKDDRLHELERRWRIFRSEVDELWLSIHRKRKVTVTRIMGDGFWRHDDSVICG